jgi:hypothetical protein
LKTLFTIVSLVCAFAGFGQNVTNFVNGQAVTNGTLVSVFASGGSAPPTPELAWFKYNEGSGTNAVDTAASHNGRLISSPGWTTQNGNGAVSFNGTSAYVDNGTASRSILNGVSSFTICFWATNTLATIESPIGWFDGAVGFGTYVLFNSIDNSTSTANKATFGYGDSSGNDLFSVSTSANTKMTDGLAHHYAMVINITAKTVTAYIDGISEPLTVVFNDAAANPTTFSGNLYVGAMNIQGTGYSDGFKGLVNDVQIFGRALSSGEVQSIYNAGSQ